MSKFFFDSVQSIYMLSAIPLEDRCFAPKTKLVVLDPWRILFKKRHHYVKHTWQVLNNVICARPRCFSCFASVYRAAFKIVLNVGQYANPIRSLKHLILYGVVVWDSASVTFMSCYPKSAFSVSKADEPVTPIGRRANAISKSRLLAKLANPFNFVLMNKAISTRSLDPVNITSRHPGIERRAAYVQKFSGLSGPQEFTGRQVETAPFVKQPFISKSLSCIANRAFRIPKLLNHFSDDWRATVITPKSLDCTEKVRFVLCEFIHGILHVNILTHIYEGGKTLCYEC